MPKYFTGQTKLLAGFLLFWSLFIPQIPIMAADSETSWNVHSHTLKNGLSVLILEDHRAPVATLQLWYRVGSRNERPGITGISHMLEHLMFRGTPTYGEGEFSRLVQERGGRHNAFTSADHTVYFESAAVEHLDLFLTLEADRMANIIIDEEGYIAEQKIVMEERRLRTDDRPASALWEQVNAAAFTAHPYGWPVVGWMNDLESITLEDVKNYWRTYYNPGNAILVIAGDVAQETVMSHVRATFGQLPRSPPVPQVSNVEPVQRGERRVFLNREASLPVYMAAYHVPNLQHEDSFALSVAALLLSGGRSGRLQRTLVEEKEVALSVSAGYDRTSLDSDLFTLSMRIPPGKTWTVAEEALFAEIDKLKTTPITDSELERAKNLVESGFIVSQDSLFYRAMQLGRYASLGNWELIFDVVPGVRRVTAEQVKLVANKYFGATNRTVGVLEPDEKPPHTRQAPTLPSNSVH